MAVLGQLIASGRSHREVFPLLGGMDYELALAERSRTGWQYDIVAGDIYPDVLPSIRQLVSAGVGIGIAGNQPEECEKCFANLGVTFDLIGSSGRWGVKKPNLDFFRRLIAETNLPPAEISYVGDHPENDIMPARALGLTTIFIRRGPWGFAFADHPSVRNASAQVVSLSGILPILDEWRRATA